VIEKRMGKTDWRGGRRNEMNESGSMDSIDESFPSIPVAVQVFGVWA